MVNTPTASIIVYLTPADAELFKCFQQRYEVMQAMEKSGVFSIGFGKAILNFANNEIQNVVIEQVGWHR